MRVIALEWKLSSHTDVMEAMPLMLAEESGFCMLSSMMGTAMAVCGVPMLLVPRQRGASWKAQRYFAVERATPVCAMECAGVSYRQLVEKVKSLHGQSAMPSKRLKRRGRRPG